ncbi:MAG TPA: penicillin-binding protein 2 [Thermoanaerobaculia bacterium]
MRVYRDDQKFLNFRINILSWSVVVVFFFLAGSFWYVQGVQAERFRMLSESNALREIPIRAKRGLIMDRNGKILTDNRPAYSLMLSRADLKQLDKSEPGHRGKMLGFVAHVLAVPPPEIEIRIQRRNDIPFNQPISIAEDMTVQQVAAIDANKLTFPALRVEGVQRRNYRYGTMAAHVMGYIGEANEKDLEENLDLKMGDLIGKRGAELVYDSVLRGRDGAQYWIVDTHGRMLSEYVPARNEPIAGKNIYLTLDFELQRRAEQYFIENEMVGAAVALDPRNGEVLAMASSPAFNPNVYSKRITPDEWKKLTSNPFKIELNRTIQGLYSPGSIFKIVMGMAGFETGVINTSTTFHCGGSAVFFGRRFRCWKQEGHGLVNWSKAIKVSCDIFFYNTGARLGVNRIAEYSRNLTFGELSKIDLEGEKAGLVPSEEWARLKQNRKWYPSETISVSIGQGPLLVTPLQIANMMSAIANDGIVSRPHVLKAIEETGPDGKVVRRRVAPEVLHQVKLPAQALQSVRDGLWSVVNEPGGTGGNARIEGLDIAGKTGTVQVIAQHGWIKSQNLPFKYRDHAWFASFAPKDKPEMVVVVFVEHGGHGGADAAPLAKQLFEARFRNQIQKQTLNLADPTTLERLKEGELSMPGEATTGPRW